MIESNEQRRIRYRGEAHAFLADQTLASGIDFNDAWVALKRCVLSEPHGEVPGSTTVCFPRLIRGLDTAILSHLLADVEGTRTP